MDNVPISYQETKCIENEMEFFFSFQFSNMHSFDSLLYQCMTGSALLSGCFKKITENGVGRDLEKGHRCVDDVI
jgi:hypothetical protein